MYNCWRRMLTAALGTLLLTIGSAEAQQLPRSVTIGTNPPGSVFYALASGLAKVVSEATPVQMTVQPYAGTSTFMPLLNSGELDFGLNNFVDMALAYQRPEPISSHSQCAVGNARHSILGGAAHAQGFHD